MCLAQGPQSSDTGEAQTRGPLVSSQALSHCALIPQVVGTVKPALSCHSKDLNDKW